MNALDLFICKQAWVNVRGGGDRVAMLKYEMPCGSCSNSFLVQRMVNVLLLILSPRPRPTFINASSKSLWGQTLLRYARNPHLPQHVPPTLPSPSLISLEWSVPIFRGPLSPSVASSLTHPTSTSALYDWRPFCFGKIHIHVIGCATINAVTGGPRAMAEDASSHLPPAALIAFPRQLRWALSHGALMCWRPTQSDALTPPLHGATHQDKRSSKLIGGAVSAIVCSEAKDISL